MTLLVIAGFAALFGAGQCFPSTTTKRFMAGLDPSEFDTLNSTLGGTLRIGKPLAAPCYSNYNGTKVTPDGAQCSTVQAQFKNETFIAQNFGGYQNVQWGECQALGQGCALDFESPTSSVPATSNCNQGSVPNYYIPVSKVEDVQAGLAFVTRTGVPLVIKNSGHDFKGRSSAPGSLALWMYPYKPPITLTKNFTPDGCSEASGDGVTIGAGQGFQGLYEFAEANDITIVGGSALTVGPAGGWVSGGGHSLMSNLFGLGVDNALQVKAVLPNGTYVTANRCQNRDILFALLGGGGGTFGVNMEVTFRAHPKVAIQTAEIAFLANGATSFNSFISILTQNANKWADDGWGGYISFGSGERYMAGMTLFNPNLSLAEATTSMAPALNFAKSFANGIALASTVTSSGSLYSTYKSYILPNEDPVGVSQSMASRLIPKSLLATASGQKSVASALSQICDKLIYGTSPTQKDPNSLKFGSPVEILLVAPSSYTPFPGESFNDSSVTPAWRTSPWHVAFGQGFSNEADAATINQAFVAANSAGDILRSITPGSGAYQNEADVFEPDPAGTFWGQENYQKLMAIKAEVDPNNILTCHGCIGWDKSDPRFACYPSIGGS